ncbi:hypothetical protein L1987_52875 [Smallanthus sonchifolius]|uniref:Uncharacterized protein n=1 Tax=Smallanthus sonchifolius TaxID=185202 RepID=A0ACB9EUM7_9ASTR|nr:hypothetical protein L1987_52875 [Smallanthus sonchifolius]
MVLSFGTRLQPAKDRRWTFHNSKGDHKEDSAIVHGAGKGYPVHANPWVKESLESLVDSDEDEEDMDVTHKNHVMHGEPTVYSLNDGGEVNGDNIGDNMVESGDTLELDGSDQECNNVGDQLTKQKEVTEFTM